MPTEVLHPAQPIHAIAHTLVAAMPSPDDRPAPEPSAFRLGHRPWLDGLRGIAILIVLLGHFQLVPGGFLGVDLFFVLSGFLITTLLVEEWERTKAINLRQFYLRRALRLAPALAAVILFGLAFTNFCRSPEEAAQFRREAVVVGCHLANWPQLHDTPLPVLGHAWSLSLEEQFYVLWPLALCLLLRTHSRRAVCLCVVAGIAGSCALRLALHQEFRAAGKSLEALARMYQGLDTRADALLTGCLIGLVAVWQRLPRGRTARSAVAGAAAATAVGVSYLVATQHLGKPLFYDGLFTLLAFGFGSIIVHLLVNPARVWRGVLEFAPLIGLGRISYGLYLVHAPVIHWLANGKVGSAYPATTAAAAATTLAAALLLFYLVERPFLRLKARLRPAPEPGAAKCQDRLPRICPPLAGEVV
jgi:peptidoglycan/LPS O-acetylase OafA/YrhL